MKPEEGISMEVDGEKGGRIFCGNGCASEWDIGQRRGRNGRRLWVEFYI